MNLQTFLQSRFRAALTGMVPDPEPYVAMVKASREAKFGDYQANCAMPLAKVLGKKPRDIAVELSERLELGDALEKPEIAGPGFINLRFQTDFIAKAVQRIAIDDRLGVPRIEKSKTFVIDYSSPNVAKPMHVGHLRSTIIGDALSRLLRFLGHEVITDNHLGDWGTQIGMLIYGWKHFLDTKALEADPVRELTRLYIHVRKLTKPADPDDDEQAEENKQKYSPEAIAEAKRVLDAVRNETAVLHAGDVKNRELWEQMMPWGWEELNRIYRRLDVKFDHTLGESFYNPMLPGVVADLQAKGIAEPGEHGAIIVQFEKPPPAIICKRDGAFTYTTSDLATIRYRADHFHPDVILYVVDFRQGSHFQPLFAIARRWGFDKVHLEHVSFGSVLGEDGRPIKTREGGAVELSTLLDMAIAAARKIVDENSPEIPEAERGHVAEVVGLGAVKYADLSQNRTSDYVFSVKKMLAMDGNTATYMQYAFARVQSIFRKGNEKPAALRTQPPVPMLDTAEERALALALLRFPEALDAAATDLKPNLITAYLWDLANAYSGFFQNCPVLKAPTPELRRSRLLLCDLTARILQQGLQLLGIQTIEQM